ncbi:SDR family oxidoreductase [Kaistia defluvii]|uniref:SDR family oxidoreductase n=1 Tax=Kaistia defluvii TaxID=410841 RepID=UPI002252EC74|nr:SDR family oxidoreductase [Kaistia defluvii]MCX5519699.1 SDR family oxidoreductase [Kaistia defluvii]
MSRDLKGKVALVTGASSGIGRATARMLAGQGARLALVGRSKERLQAVRDEFPDVEALVIAADLTKPAEVERTIAETVAGLGPIDILLANAGLYLTGDLVDGDPDDFDEVIGVNINAVFRAVRAVLPSMIERRAGDIIVTSSVAGHQAIPWEPVYSATKHAVQAFVHGVRRQVAPHGIRVGAVAPGVVLNELWGYSDPAVIAAKAAAREGLLSEDIADAVLFMLTRPANVTIRDLVILPQNQDI